MKHLYRFVRLRVPRSILVLTLIVTMQPAGSRLLLASAATRITSCCPSKLREEPKIDVSYAPSNPKFSLGEPVIVNFSVTNRLGEPVNFDLGHNGRGAFKFTVIQPDGMKMTNRAQMIGEGLSWPSRHKLAPEQTYTQRLVLNEWFEFSKPGFYQVEVRLEDPIRKSKDGVAISYGKSQFTFEIEVRNESRLKQVCESMLERISQSRNNYESALDAAIPLSYVNDPLAVTYLEQAIDVNPLTYYVAIQGLGRIGDAQAVRVLIRYLKNKENGEDWPLQAMFVLQEVEKATIDKVVKQEVTRALEEYSRNRY